MTGLVQRRADPPATRPHTTLGTVGLIPQTMGRNTSPATPPCRMGRARWYRFQRQKAVEPNLCGWPKSFEKLKANKRRQPIRTYGSKHATRYSTVQKGQSTVVPLPKAKSSGTKCGWPKSFKKLKTNKRHQPIRTGTHRVLCETTIARLTTTSPSCNRREQEATVARAGTSKARRSSDQAGCGLADAPRQSVPNCTANASVRVGTHKRDLHERERHTHTYP